MGIEIRTHACNVTTLSKVRIYRPVLLHKAISVGLLFKIRAFFQPKRKYEVQGTRYKMADFWIRPGIVTCNGSSKALTVELEYAPSVGNHFDRMNSNILI